MPFYYLPNLSAGTTTPIDEPWTAEGPRPTFPDKEAYRLWCNALTTEWAFVSAVEGKIPGLRVSEDNPPARLCGLVLDFDAVPAGPPEVLILNNAPNGLRPAWVSRTYSGNCRVYYRFEEPIPLFTKDIAKKLVKKLVRELKLRKILNGFEVEAMEDLAKYFEIGTDFVAVDNGQGYIPRSLLHGWLAEVSKTHKWATEGTVIPIDSLREEAEHRWPDRWPSGWSTFDIGARGPRFWDDTASDPTAIMVRESGCQFFSDGGGFMTWEAIFGTQFVRNWAQNRRGAAIAGRYFDGQRYWSKNATTGEWYDHLKTDVELAIRHECALTRKSGEGLVSEVEAAIYDIQNTNRVRGALPFVYLKDGPLTVNGARYLNISTLMPTSPTAATVTEYGDGFPWLAQYLSSLFDPDDQLEYFMTWVQHFYKSAYTQSPKRGLALFIAGPAGVGKTFLNKAFLGQLMGSSQDASSYLLGGEKFNENLFRTALWTVDDAVTSNDQRQRDKFSQMVKTVVANDSFEYRAMYRSGENLAWVGRVVTTLNDDPESLQVLPTMDISIADKVMFLRAKVPDVDYWPTDAQLALELPFFAKWILQWTPPAHCLPPANRARFGVVGYRHPSLVESARALSVAASFSELLDEWRLEWFAEQGTEVEYWQGTATTLLNAFSVREGIKAIVVSGRYNARTIGMNLHKLMRSGHPGIEARFTATSRDYRIYRYGSPALTVVQGGAA